jgi:hypothetical protein
MKNIFTLLLVLFLLFHLQIKAQITQAFARGNVAHVSYQHLELAGEKILVIDTNYVNWTLLNLDNTVYSSGVLPSAITNDYSCAVVNLGGAQGVSGAFQGLDFNIFASQNLFNANSQIEFLFHSNIIDNFGSCGGTTVITYTPKIIIFDENGTNLLFKAGYTLANIFNSGNSALMILKKHHLRVVAASGFSATSGVPNSDSTIIYNLSGQLDCSNCNLNNQANSIIQNNDNTNKSSFNVFPNPFNENVNIEYNLPKNSINPLIEIFDALGKSIKKINLQDTEGNLVLNSTEFSKGIYFYVISANGEIIQDKKMIKFE